MYYYVTTKINNIWNKIKDNFIKMLETEERGKLYTQLYMMQVSLFAGGKSWILIVDINTKILK